MVIDVTMCSKDFVDYIKDNKDIVYTYRHLIDGICVSIQATFYNMIYPFDYMLIRNDKANKSWEMPTDIINELSIMAKQ